MPEKPCSGGCGTMIHFDANDKISYGKWRPLEHDNSPHHCPGPVGQEQYGSQQQQMDIPPAPQPYNPQPQQQQQQVAGLPRPQVVQIEKGTFDRLREQIVSINQFMSQIAIDIDEIKQAIAIPQSRQPLPEDDNEF